MAINHAPLAPTPTEPLINSYIFYLGGNAFRWTFNDPDPGDTQSRADFRYRAAGAGSWTTVTNAATTAFLYVVAASTFTVDTQYEWQVSCWDQAGLQSPWSYSLWVTTIDSPTTPPTITSPASGSAQASTPVTLAWTLPAGFTQEAYRVYRQANGFGAIYYDSGIVESSWRSAQIPLDAVRGRTDLLLVQFRYCGAWSPLSNVSVVNQFDPPHTPLLIAAQVSGRPEVVISITNPAASTGFEATVFNDLYRTGIDGVRIRIAAALPVNASFTDLLPGAGNINYTVTAYAASGGTATSY